ncbi:MAG: HAMP domain-containing sensor histidine kinase [Candidatus Obscuribacterales bacterium]
MTDQNLNLNRLTVKQKGFILVSLPLLFGVLFISILIPLLSDFNSAVNKERASRAAIADGNRTFLTVYQSICKFTDRVATKQEEEQKEFEQSLAQLALTAQTLRKTAESDQDAETRKNHLLLASGLEQLSQLGSILSNEENLSISRLDALISHQRFYKIAQPLAAQIDHSLEVKSAALKKIRQDLDFKLLVIFIAVTVGTICNLILTIALFKLLISSLTSRIKILSENAFRLSASAPLLELESSGDELAMVEQAFFNMAAEIQAVEAAKQDYLTAISHDFRTPIASIIATMTAASRKLYGDLSPQGIELALDQGQKLDALTRTVNDLLTLERLEAGMLELDMNVHELGDILLMVEEKLDAQYSRSATVLERLNFQNVAVQLPVNCDSDKLVLALQRLIEAAITDSARPIDSTITTNSTDKTNTTNSASITISARAERSFGLIVISYQTAERRPSRKFLFDRSERRHRLEEGDERFAALQTSLSLCQALIEKLDGEVVVLCDQLQHSFIVKLKLNQREVEQ